MSATQSSAPSAAAPQGKGLMTRYFLDQDDAAVAALLGNDEVRPPLKENGYESETD